MQVDLVLFWIFNDLRRSGKAGGVVPLDETEVKVLVNIGIWRCSSWNMSIQSFAFSPMHAL